MQMHNNSLKRFNWFSFYPNDWLTSPKIIQMTPLEECAYFRLLCYAWVDRFCSLPNDEPALQAMAKWTPQGGDWRDVMRCFTTHPENKKRLCNPRLLEEWRKGHQLTEVKRAAARKRWEKTDPIPSKPLIISKDRTSKGLSPVSAEVAAVADKWFPPV